MLPKDFKFSQKWQNFNKSGHSRHGRHRLVLLDVPAPEQELTVQVRPERYKYDKFPMCKLK